MLHGEFGPDRLCCGGPDKGFGVPIHVGDIAGDPRFEVVHGAEDTPFEALPGELGEEALHGIEPGAGGRREWNVHRG